MKEECGHSQEQEKEQAKNGLQRMFDQFIQRGIDHGGVEVKENGNLNLYSRKVEVKKPQPELAVSILNGTEVFGAIGDQAVFWRSKRSLGSKSLKSENIELKQDVQWILSAEGPFQEISYHQDLDGEDWLRLRYLTRQEPALGKGGVYLNSKGIFILSKPDCDYKYPLISAKNPFYQPELDIGFGISNDIELISGCYPVLANKDEREIEESIFLPRHIDVNVWLSKFLDEHDQVINDPKMPWINWFDELGCKFEFKEVR